MSLLERDNRTHGTVSCYKDGCQCEPCKAVPMQIQDRKRKKAIAGIPVKDLFQCYLCGRLFPSKQSRGSHEAHCEW